MSTVATNLPRGYLNIFQITKTKKKNQCVTKHRLPYKGEK